MRILNTKNPEDVAKIYPWLIPTEKETRIDIASELYGRLKEEPDDTLVLVAIERNVTRAILIAHVSNKKKRSCWLWQANTEVGFKYSKLMFDSLMQWSRSKGCRKIVTKVSDENKRPLMCRKYGFKIRGKEMYLNVTR